MYSSGFSRVSLLSIIYKAVFVFKMQTMKRYWPPFSLTPQKPSAPQEADGLVQKDNSPVYTSILDSLISHRSDRGLFHHTLDMGSGLFRRKCYIFRCLHISNNRFSSHHEERNHRSEFSHLCFHILSNDRRRSPGSPHLRKGSPDSLLSQDRSDNHFQCHTDYMVQCMRDGRSALEDLYSLEMVWVSWWVLGMVLQAYKMKDYS